MRRTTRSLWIGAVLLACLTACGTTVPNAALSYGSDGLSGPQASPGATAPGQSDVSAPTVGSGPIASGGGSVPVPGNAGGASTVGTGPSVGGSATTATLPVQVGFLVTKCSNCSLLGASYVAPAHSEQQVLQALVNDVNSRGGLLGHKIEPVWGVEDTASSDVSTMMQSICSTFTQDHHVVAVLGAGFSFQDLLARCLAKAGVPTFDATRSTGVPDDQDLATYAGYVITNEPSANAYALSALTSGVADGWLTPTTKLGVLDFDCPESARVWQRTTQPYLNALGLKGVVHSTLSCPKGAADLGSAAQGVQSAELKMHADGVDTVAITDIPLVVFAEDAESQQWHPHYLASEGAASYQTYLPADQVKNIHAAGWEPSYDLDSQHQPPLTPAEQTCLAAIKRGGLTNQVVSERVAYFSLCGSVLLYTRVVAAAQSLATPDVLRATNAIGRAFVNPMLLGGQSLLAQGKHAAAVQYRSILLDASCNCFLYHGPARPLPTTS